MLTPQPAMELTKAYEADAFIGRSRVLANALNEFGPVIVYGGEQHETRVSEYVPIIDRKWQARHFPGFKTTDVFSDYDASHPHWIEFNVRAADAIRQRAQKGDIVGITMGTSQQLISTLLADMALLFVEVGIGYSGVWASYRVYESWAWRTFHAGRAVGQAMRTDPNPDIAGDVRNFDAVIPRPYELADFPAGDGSGGYFLFMGRVVARKGPQVAAEVCRRLGAKLLVAGQNVAKVEPGRITSSDGTVLEGDVEFVGVIGPEERAKLMGGAIATFTPTLYTGPFEGVHAESMLTGTPVISTPHGCFIEYVQDGVNGYKCSTLAEFTRAAKDVESLDRDTIRSIAQRRYGSDTVGRQYDQYLNRLKTLGREGWYELPTEPIRRAA